MNDVEKEMTDETLLLQTISVSLGPRSYPILVGNTILPSLGRIVAPHVAGKQVGIVSDVTVRSLYGEVVKKSLSDAGHTVVEATIPAGEQHKTLATVSRVLDAFLDARFDRESTIIALGGGVVGDIAGFAAAILLRGVRFVQIPTTVVAQVDASVGGKTGVDHPRGKNLIGAFHQPSLVFIDVATLATLPERELKAGLAEVVKHAVIQDADLFARLEAELPQYASRSASPDAWVELMASNCRIKARVVAEDERESGLRAILNYGHTTGHAVEALGAYERYRHGEAVLFGMCVAGALARRRGMWTDREERRQRRLIDTLATVDPPTDLPVSVVWDAMRSDKKVRAGVLRFVLPTRIGDATLVDDVSESEFRAAWDGVIGAGAARQR